MITPLHSKLRVSREEVFRPSHRLPTISVEEYGDMMKKQMIEDATSRASFAEKQDVRDEDDEEEEKLRKARAWDDWKDDHRRGEGNSRLRPCGR